MSDAPVTRAEMDRLRSDLNALTILVSTDIARRWGPDGIARWHETYSASSDSTNEAPEIKAMFGRAIDRLGVFLSNAAKARQSD